MIRRHPSSTLFPSTPLFRSADEPHPLPRMLELSGVFMVLTFAVFVVYGLFAAAVRSHVISRPRVLTWMRRAFAGAFVALRSEEHTSELQSQSNLVCRLLLET